MGGRALARAGRPLDRLAGGRRGGPLPPPPRARHEHLRRPLPRLPPRRPSPARVRGARPRPPRRPGRLPNEAAAVRPPPRGGLRRLPRPAWHNAVDPRPPPGALGQPAPLLPPRPPARPPLLGRRAARPPRGTAAARRAVRGMPPRLFRDSVRPRGPRPAVAPGRHAALRRNRHPMDAAVGGVPLPLLVFLLQDRRRRHGGRLPPQRVPDPSGAPRDRGPLRGALPEIEAPPPPLRRPRRPRARLQPRLPVDPTPATRPPPLVSPRRRVDRGPRGGARRPLPRRGDRGPLLPPAQPEAVRPREIRDRLP